MLRIGAPFGVEHGVVVVMTAVMLLPFTLLLAFAIEPGWWWTHHRHLQTQADAAALAGGQGPWLPGCNDTPSDPTSIVGKALQYAGDQNRLLSTYNLQYSNAGHVHALINSTNYWDNGGTDNSAPGGSPCTSLTTFAGATCNPQSVAPTCPNVDVKMTEATLPTFFGSIPGVTSVNERTHARVEIQAIKQENGIRPVAVRDDSAYQCARIQFVPVDGSTPTIASISLGAPTKHNPDAGDPTAWTQFQGSSTVPMPSTALSQYVQVALYGSRDPSTGNCLGAADVFPQDSSGNAVGGVNFINVYSTAGPQGTIPALHSASISGNCAPDSYFSSVLYYPAGPDPCSVTVTASVDFPGSARNPKITIGGTTATPNGTNTVWTANFSVASQSGPQLFPIHWSYQGNAGADFANAPQQQTYAGTSDDTAASSSDGLAMVSIACTANCGSSGSPNSFQKSASPSPTLSFTVHVAGLENSRPTDPPFILRYAVQGQTNSKRTGIVDCWDNTSSAQSVHDAIVNGCPRPLYLWTSGNCGPPPPNAAPDTSPMPNPIDCVGIVPGNKRGPVKQALIDRIGTSCDNWLAWKASNGTLRGFPPAGDPRVMTLIITPPVNLSGNGGSTADVPVVQLAAFYVTGADGLKNPAPSCSMGGYATNQNEAFPGKGSSNSAIWGHFIKFVGLGGGVGNSTGCNPNQFGDCVAVLTQ